MPRYSLIGLVALLSVVAASGRTPKQVAKHAAPPADINAKAQGPAPSWLWTDARAENTFAFRKEFEVKGILTRAQLYAAGDEIVVSIGDKDVLDVRRWATPEMRDVTELLLNVTKGGVGKHTLGLRARANPSKGGVLAKLVLESAGGETQIVVTDGTWRTTGAAQRGEWWRVGYDDSGWTAAKIVAGLGDRPFDPVTPRVLDAARPVRDPSATAPESLKVAKDFKVELLYSVPKDAQGSWVSMCVDPKGRLIVCDQYGGLYRVTPPPLGGTPEATRRSRRSPSTSARPRACSGRSTASTSSSTTASKYRQRAVPRPRHQRRRRARQGRAAPRARAAAASTGRTPSCSTPDGKSLYVVCGNQTQADASSSGSRVPPVWGEDHLLPRMPDGRGFMAGVLGPGGCIYQVDPDGKNWELFCVGFRNEYDAAFNRHGELFTYDADMEWDINTPWYRPRASATSTSGSGVRLAQRRGQVAGVLPRQPAGGRRHRPRLADGRRASATGRSSRRSIRRRSSSATGATASSTPSTSRRNGAAYKARGRGVRHRHAAAADRRRRQPARRRDVLRHRRPAGRSRACTA